MAVIAAQWVEAGTVCDAAPMSASGATQLAGISLWAA